jgi:tetratricopeptide (TPR) repeat protein
MHPGISTLQAQNSVASVSSGQAQILHNADSLFFIKNWKTARSGYLLYCKNPDPALAALTWNRLGYCNHNLGLYDEALKDYSQSLSSKPSPFLRSVVESRIAEVYSRLQNTGLSLQHLDSAARAGFFNTSELDTSRDFDFVRNDGRFKDLYRQVYTNAYPCSADEKAREFDFWIGEWDVFNAATNSLAGHSLIQKISGGCALLENYNSTIRAYEGKSINYYEGSIGKWEQVWVGSSGVENPVKDMQHFVEGEYKDGAMRFVFETMVNGQKATGRFIFYNLGADKVRQYQETSTDGGKTFQVGYDLIYIRKK